LEGVREKSKLDDGNGARVDLESVDEQRSVVLPPSLSKVDSQPKEEVKEEEEE
jgi:hypothetical protein